MTLNIIKDYIPGRPEDKAELYNGKPVIVVHNTATFNATAKNENTYFHNNWSNVQAFVHALVDWTNDVYETAQFGDVVWGAGTVNKYAYLQVEQCISQNDDENQQSADNMAKYIALKLKENNLSVDDVYIISHADASVQFGGTDHNDTVVGITWDELISKIRAYTTDAVTTTPVSPTPEPTKPANIQYIQTDGKYGFFRLNYDIKARADGPDTTNRLTYIFKKGDTIKVDRVLKANGYYWISQLRSNGSYWYIPICENGKTDLWGSFK